MKGLIKKLFWVLPIKHEIKIKLSQKRFEWLLNNEKKYDEQKIIKVNDDAQLCIDYAKYVLESYKLVSEDYKSFEEHKLEKNDNLMIVAYYLTQFHPNSHNDSWWGKGTTEWNNVNQAVPQFIGHYQPRKPGELGYYDLRIKDVFKRQIELAKNYGIGAFCFYYYWFDEERLLEKPLEMFLKNRDLNIPFFYCWANENWTKRFSGTNDDVLMGITHTEENYINFIDDIIDDFEDERYYKIDGRAVLSVYRPSMIPNPKVVIEHWREKAKQLKGYDLYLIAVQERDISIDWKELGFDAETEFQPKQIQHNCKLINKEVGLIRKDFGGFIYDYEDLVVNKRYSIPQNKEKLVYPAVMPMWDNSARRNFRGVIFHKATPGLYKEWMKDVIREIKENRKMTSKMVFVNAWNEWGEGAYLEPDHYYGYAFLQATWEARNEVLD